MPSAEPSIRRCVICGKPQVEGRRPFCSKRCADVDLHRWLTGSYAIPAEEEAELEDLPRGKGRDTGQS
jgi:endogenous inhibitor of DNA gyrase (YacG/DUF329 family)